MKIRRTTVIGYLLTLSLILVFSASNTSCQSHGPKDVVMGFDNALAKKNVDALTPFLINEPEYVAKRSFEEYRRIYGIDPEGESAAAAANDTNSPSVTRGLSRNLAGEELVNWIVPVDLFFTQDRRISKINSISINGDEAVLKVGFAGRDPSTGKNLKALDYDILLHKENNGWKIFALNARHTGDERYYTYDFYAANREP